MDEGAEGCHRKVEGVANYHNKDEGDPSANAAVAEGHLRQIVEGEAEHAARKAEGVETEVAQDVAEHSGRGIVGLPQSGADIEQGIAVEVVQEEDAQSG